MLRFLHLVAAAGRTSALFHQKREGAKAARTVGKWQHGHEEPSTPVWGRVPTGFWRVKVGGLKMNI